MNPDPKRKACRLHKLPLCDDHLPLLYQWNRDPEVLYWCEADDITLRSEEETQGLFSWMSKNANAICFLIEHNGTPVGECWLQPNNLPDLAAAHPQGADLRRIDMSIGEKAYWERGIGTQVLALLVDFAFNNQQADALYGYCEDYNLRSQAVLKKNGFALVKRQPSESPKAQEELCFCLTREEHFNA